MGPIEIVFLVMVALFGVIGVVRGYARELGVTLLLLLALFVLVYLETSARPQINKALGELFNLDPNDPSLDVARNLIYCVFLAVIAYASYQGETLAYPGQHKSDAFGLVIGLLNGYLLAGSLWNYLHKARWPLLNIHEPFSSFYNSALGYLPPVLFDWKLLIALVVVLLILRVWK